jgi:hypothetical protein
MGCMCEWLLFSHHGLGYQNLLLEYYSSVLMHEL